MSFRITKPPGWPAWMAFLAVSLMLAMVTPGAACQNNKNASVLQLSGTSVMQLDDKKTSVVTVPADAAIYIPGVRSKSKDTEYCLDWMIVGTPDYNNTIFGAAFWLVKNELGDNKYVLYIKGNQYEVVHWLNDRAYILTPFTNDVSIKTGIHNTNEIVLQLDAKGANIVINGVSVDRFVARPVGEEFVYAVAFQAPAAGQAVFQVQAQIIAK